MLGDYIISDSTVTVFLYQEYVEFWSDKLKNIFVEIARCQNCGENINKDLTGCSCEAYLQDEMIGCYTFSIKHYQKDGNSEFHEEIRKAKRRMYSRESSASRKERERYAEGSHSKKELEKLRNFQENKCYYCGVWLEAFQADHLIPLSKGGSAYIQNIVLSCGVCNRKKHNKSVAQFWKVLEEEKSKEWVKFRKEEAKRINQLKILFSF